MNIEEKNKTEIKKDSQENKTFGCVYLDCNLRYKRKSKLIDHIKNYNHFFFNKRNLDQQSEFYTYAIQEKNETLQSDPLNLINLLSSPHNEIVELFSFIFVEGMLFLNDDYVTESMFCRIPGCGKVFKSIIAYKYHIQKEYHSLKSAVNLLMNVKSKNLSTDFIKIFAREYKINDKFEVSGVSHHIFDQYDLFYPVKFCLDKELAAISIKRSKIKMKRKTKKESLIENEEISEESQEPVLPTKLIIDQSEYNINQLNSSTFYHSKFKIKSFNEEITAISSIHFQNTSLIFVSTKQEIKIEEIFNFAKPRSTISVLDNNFNTLYTFNSPFGFIRKMELKLENESVFVIALFSDGVLRSFKFKEDFYNFYVYKSEVIDFLVLKNNTLILTDGDFIYKIDKEIEKIKLKSAEKILKIAVQEDESQFFVLNNQSKIFKYNSTFTNSQKILSNLFVTEIFYFNFKDILCVSDTLNYNTRFIDLFSLTSTFFDGASSSFCFAENDFFLGDFHGAVRKIEVRNMKINAKMLFKAVKVKDTINLVYNNGELTKFKQSNISFDHFISVKSVSVIDECIYVGLGCGLLISYFYK